VYPIGRSVGCYTTKGELLSIHKYITPGRACVCTYLLEIRVPLSVPLPSALSIHCFCFFSVAHPRSAPLDFWRALALRVVVFFSGTTTLSDPGRSFGTWLVHVAPRAPPLLSPVGLVFCDRVFLSHLSPDKIDYRYFIPRVSEDLDALFWPFLCRQGFSPLTDLPLAPFRTQAPG